ncbi:MAG: enoyl-CoA hydratase/isomerase family protein, partial [Alphaproteobacteria bacterium]|nr:enoyl-CoA hydratase/isomerase family protein [Alphaproteobacteria bacterium]
MTDVRVEKKGSVAVVTLSSKSGLNYIDVECLRLLSREVEKLDVEDDAVRTIVLSGSEKAFSSGIDPTYFVRNVNAEVLDEMFENFDKLANVKKTTIAEVSGYAVGIGFEIALACDMLFCSDNTWFSVPDLSLGTVAGFGATQRLPKAIGKAKTMEMLLTGRARGAEEAERI